MVLHALGHRLIMLQTLDISNILLLNNSGVIVVEKDNECRIFSGRNLLVTLSSLHLSNNCHLSVIICDKDQLIINITKRKVYDFLIANGKVVVGNIPPEYKITIRSLMFLGSYRAALFVGPSSSNNYKGQRLLGLYNSYNEANERRQWLEKLGELQIDDNDLTRSYQLGL